MLAQQDATSDGSDKIVVLAANQEPTVRISAVLEWLKPLYERLAKHPPYLVRCGRCEDDVEVENHETIVEACHEMEMWIYALEETRDGNIRQGIADGDSVDQA